MLHRVFSAAVFLLLMLVSGCRDQNGPTGGRVRFEDGTPVQTGVIEFRSLLGDWKRSGHIQRDGSFVLRDGDDVVTLPPSEYEVIVAQVIITEHLAAEHHSHGREVPLRFADYNTSALNHTVLPGDTEPIEIVVGAN